MLHLKSYLGSIVLAGLLLQGCGGSSDSAEAAASTGITTTEKFTSYTELLAAASNEDKTQSISDLTLKIASLDVADSEMYTYISSVVAQINEIEGVEDTTRGEAYAAIATAIVGAPEETSGADAGPSRSILGDITSVITDPIGDGLVSILDTSVGNAITSATFDVVLNSDGVTVVMIDAARASELMAEIMVDALEADWSLTEKMCPMLQENVEFGEKFTALAEESDIIGRFFFERIDANMYGCLTDAMLLSNNDAEHGIYGEPGDTSYVYHSTNAYMGLLMDRYATDYFIMPDTADTDYAKRRNDQFVSLLLDTGDVTTYDAETKTFTGHGDANELISEKFFYSLFKTPGTTNAFVSAMEKVEDADAVNNTETLTMLMDNIFLGTNPENDTVDTMQGHLNIISIGSAMYDGIYGEVSGADTRTGAYGFASYTGAFVGFAGLIPGDRYIPYGKAFINAGYEYANFHGISLWTGVSDSIKSIWADEEVVVDGSAPSRSAGLGIYESDWVGDITNLFSAAWGELNLVELWAAFTDDGDTTVLGEISDQTNAAIDTLIDGRNDNNESVYPTTISNGTIYNDHVYGFHGLIELAIQEDVYFKECGNSSTRGILSSKTVCENNTSYTMTDANASFQLPPFSDLTWSYAYGVAKDGAATYISNIDAVWIADLSTNELVREYFYPDANNTYIPSWILAIDWLTVPANYANSGVMTTDVQLDFNSGYVDVYTISDNPNLIENIDLSSVLGVEMTKVGLGDDSIVVLSYDGTYEGRYVYKIRVVSPENVEAVLAILGGYVDVALDYVGIDTSNAADVDTTTAE